MAYAYNHLKITFGGSIYDKDIWTCGVNFGHENGNVGFETPGFETLVDDVATDVSTWFTSPGSWIPASAKLKWVKLAFIDTDGRYFRDAVTFDYDGDIPGGNSNAGQLSAPQCTVAQTFVTNVRRGPGRHGRIYPPLNAIALNSQGVMADNATLQMSVTCAKLLSDIGATLSTVEPDTHAIVASKVGAGINARITGVTVGNVIDTQRSRRNAFVETYSVTTLVTNGE